MGCGSSKRVTPVKLEVIEQPPEALFDDNWYWCPENSRWQLKKSNGNWETFTDTANGISSNDLSEAFKQYPRISVYYKFQNVPFVINLEQMTQVNLQTKVSSPMRREVLQGQNTVLRAVTEDRSTVAEYRSVAKLFHKTMATKVLISVQRIQNADLYEQFYFNKIRLEKKMKDRKGIRHLFHGTSRKNIDSICSHGFDSRLFQTHAYGRGSYFARDASYSHNFTDCNRMFLVEVLVGEYIIGNPNLIRPPQKPFNEFYDSCVDNMRDPAIFVKFDSASAYPMYLLEYN